MAPWGSQPTLNQLKLSNSQTFQSNGGQKDPESFLMRSSVVFLQHVCMSLERAVEVSGEGVRSGD